jgi:acyl-CoA reductase-like NAD-dependent aldehyde dehydrogenase
MLENVLHTIHKERNIFTEMITESTGKPITQSKQEFDQMIIHSREYINIFKSDLADFKAGYQ